MATSLQDSTNNRTLISPEFTLSGTGCLNFSYIFNGDGEKIHFRVDQVYTDRDGQKRLLSAHGSQDSKWNQLAINIEPGKARLYFQMVISSDSLSGSLLIDDVSVTLGACATPPCLYSFGFFLNFHAFFFHMCISDYPICTISYKRNKAFCSIHLD